MQKTETQPQQLTALVPADPLGTRFCQYFSNSWKHIYRPLAAVGEKTQWITAKYFLNPRTLWERYLDPSTIIGLRFRQTTRYCLLDVDRGSYYHPANDEAAFKSVLAALEEIGLCRPLVVRSSDSGGLHIYYFFDEPLPTFALACALWFALNDAGLRVRSGQLETFPNIKAWNSLYNGCRLPLQAGSYLLNRDLEILTNDLSQFLDAADTAAAHQDLPKLKEAIAKAEKRPKRRQTNKLQQDVEVWKAEWEQIITQGWTGSGQTNDLLKIMVAYGTVFQGLEGKDLVDYVEATAIAAPGYQEYCNHQHEIRQRAQHWTSSTEHNEFYSKYCSYPNRRGTYKQTYGSEPANNVICFKSNLNEQRSNEATDRLRQAVSHLKEIGKLPVAVAARAKAIIAAAKNLFGKGISMLTLRKSDYLKLWHPKYYEGDSVAQSSIQRSIDCEIQPEMQSLTSSTEKKNGGTASGSESMGLSGVINLEAHCVTQTEIYSVTQTLKQEDVIQTEVSSEPLSNNDSAIWITPPPCSTEKQPKPELPEPLPSKDSSSLDHTSPLMKVCVSVNAWEASQKASQASPSFATFQNNSNGNNCCSTRRDPSADDCHTNCHTPAAPAAPAASIESEAQPAAPQQPAAAPGSSGRLPSIIAGQSPEVIRRLTNVWLKASPHAKKTVQIEQQIKGCEFIDEERNRRETIAKMQFFWRSGEPQLMDEVKLWLADHPGVSLNI